MKNYFVLLDLNGGGHGTTEGNGLQISQSKFVELASNNETLPVVK